MFFFTDESRFTLFFVLTGDVVCTDVVGDGLPTLAFSRGIDMEEGRLWYGKVMKSPLIVVPGNLTAARYRDEILRPVAVPLVQQHQMTFQHDNARPHVARVCQVFLETKTLYHSTGHRTVQICPQLSICGTNWTGA